PDDDKAKKRLSESLTLYKSLEAIGRMIKSAQSEPCINISDPGVFDADPVQFGCLNGVLDLATGKLLKAERDQYITNQGGFAYDPAAKCPLWLETLDAIFEGNAELIDLIQRLFGLSLTGNADEEIFMYLDGTGGNGKSLFCEVLAAVLGS